MREVVKKGTNFKTMLCWVGLLQKSVDILKRNEMMASNVLALVESVCLCMLLINRKKKLLFFFLCQTFTGNIK